MLSGREDAAFLTSFLNPATGSQPQGRFLYPNSRVRPSCPVFQRNVIESQTVDVGQHQVRHVLLQPHVSAPIMVSHQTLPFVNGVLFNGVASEGGLCDMEAGGFYSGNQRMPWFRSFRMPAFFSSLGNGAGVGVPIHGAFYSPSTVAANTPSSAVAPGNILLRDFTEVNNATGDFTGVHGLPLGPDGNDVIVVHMGFASPGTSLVDNVDLSIRLGLCDAGGTVTYQTTVMNITRSLAANGVASCSISPTAGTIALTSLELVNTRGTGFTLDIGYFKVVHALLSGVTVNNGVGSGSFVGAPVRGLASVTASCQAARVTSASLLLTNTTSSLNANGFITACGVQAALPSNTGLLGIQSIGALATARSFPFVDGCYSAIAPNINLDYESLDSSPSLALNRVVMTVKGQDNTPVIFKLEYNVIVEVISQDPLFPAQMAVIDQRRVQALQMLQESGAYLILSENKLHWNSIKNAIKALLVGASAAGMASGHPEVAAAAQAASGALSTADSAYQAIRPLLPKKKKSAKQSVKVAKSHGGMPPRGAR